ncbi:conserved hypothetical protein [gamma proteobacterium NOR5-3]|nr:conserved hypothetical protein [gamma proteobacterium NOR5-3]
MDSIKNSTAPSSAKFRQTDPPAMSVRAATDSDAVRWDAYVNAHSQGTPYHLWSYKQALEGSYRLRTVYCVAEDDKQNLVGVLPCAQLPHPLGRGSLCALPYCDRGDALSNDPLIGETLLTHVLETATRPMEVRASDTAAVPDVTLRPGQKARLLLELPSTPEELLAGFKSKHRSQINKAKKNGLTTHIGNNEQLLDDFYAVFTRNMRDLGSPTHSRAWFDAIAHNYGEQCVVGVVKLNDMPVGAGIVLMAGKRASIPWASTLRDYNRLAPNMLLYWSLLEQVITQGVTLFDFGRSSVGEGTFRFKTQWGAKPELLNWKTVQPRQQARATKAPEQSALPDSRVTITDTNTETAAAVAKSSMRTTAESCWRHLPLAVTVHLGSRIRPWISL